ncbi:uncharacterized protein LOC132642740 [Lycium barbarum]|uniref:uncharacterized protein LOC132642740 n=1 Tax=Lycium barbarum TaxID=112863 RepID=UPI00293EFB3A|nr:uncharacterized protein LOC132642740 [Lycium barbarum]
MSTSEAPLTASARPGSTSEAPPTASARPRSTSQAPTRGMGTRRTTITAKWFENATSYAAPVAANAPVQSIASQSNVSRGRSRKTSQASSAAPVAANAPDQPAASQSNVSRGRPRKTSQASSVAPVAANAPDQPAASQSNVRRGRPRKTSQASSVTTVDNERRRTTPYKRPRTVGMGIFVAENRFTTYNHGLPSSRIIDAAPRKHIRSAVLLGTLVTKQGLE